MRRGKERERVIVRDIIGTVRRDRERERKCGKFFYVVSL